MNGPKGKTGAKKTLAALGDSLTYGFPFDPSLSWVETLRKKTGWQVINAGVSGDTLGDMLARLERDVLSYRPELVTVMGGTNDIYQGMSQPQLQQSFLAILTVLKDSNIRVIAGLPLPVDDGVERALRLWRHWLLEYCRREGLAVLDFYSDFVGADGRVRDELLIDGCHPRIVGYETMARRALAVFFELGLFETV